MTCHGKRHWSTEPVDHTDSYQTENEPQTSHQKTSFRSAQSNAAIKNIINETNVFGQTIEDAERHVLRESLQPCDIVENCINLDDSFTLINDYVTKHNVNK